MTLNKKCLLTLCGDVVRDRFCRYTELAYDWIKVVRYAVGGEEDDVAGVDEGEAAREVTQLGVYAIDRTKGA